MSLLFFKSYSGDNKISSTSFIKDFLNESLNGILNKEH